MRLTALLLACTLVLPVIAAAGKGGKAKGGRNEEGGRDGRDGASVSVGVVFGDRERAAARDYFVGAHGRGKCPPGLAKKHNGCLPPGQAKKRYVVGQPLPRGIAYGPLPRELELRIGPAPRGYVYGMLDGDLVKLAAGTALVVDAVQGLVD